MTSYGDERDNYRSDPYYNPARKGGMNYIPNAGESHKKVRCPVCDEKYTIVDGKDEGCPAGCVKKVETKEKGEGTAFGLYKGAK